jgi:magnesium transporter
MVYLSEILGITVIDPKSKSYGKLDDLQINPESGLVQRIVVRQKRKLSMVPWSNVDTLSPETRKLTVARQAEIHSTEKLEEESIYLKRDVLDRQIIDTRGRKVVRVNDVLLDPINGNLGLRGVEIGLGGAVRRLVAGILSPRMVRHLANGLSVKSIPWEYVGLVEPRSAQIRLKVHQQLARMHPADLADILEDLGRMERKTLVSSLDTITAAQALSEVEAPVQASVVEDMQVEQVADILEEMQPDEAADILGELPEERSNALLEAMAEKEAEDLRELLTFDENTAGGLMNTEFFTAEPRWTVSQTLSAFRKADPDLLGEMDEIPLVEPNGKLVGMVPLVRLVRREPEEAVTTAMRRSARAVQPGTHLSEVIERFEKYHLRGLAVVDDFGALVGLISIEDLLTYLIEKG